MLKIVIASDHGGFEYKKEIFSFLTCKGYDVEDVGTFSKDSCDYPIYANKAATLVGNGKCDFGIVICRSGEGVCIVSNKTKGVRCGIGYNDEVSKLMRLHNDANMIAFGSDFQTLDEVKNRILIFLNTKFLGERHSKRVDQIKEIEK